MQARAASKSPTRLQPPRRTSIADPGAHELESSDNEEDHFSDASEGRYSRPASPAKLGVPGTERQLDPHEHSDSGPYGFRDADVSSDEEVGGESSRRRGSKMSEQGIPTTVVEKVDPFTPSYGEVPGTMAYEMRRADAEPDVVVGSDDAALSRSRSGSTPGNLPVPITKVSVVDSPSASGDPSGKKVDERHQGDAEPDVIVQGTDPQGAPTTRSINPNQSSFDDHSYGEDAEDKSLDMAIGDDFDDFEGGGVDEDFGDFDTGFNDDASVADDEGTEHITANPPQSLLAAKAPLLDYSTLAGTDEVIEATSKYMDEIFPWDRDAEPGSADNLQDGDTMFITERSLSLWSQLVAAPPLQPPNWVRSRIRRLFLVSLGVPVDLDEILPASKQKKLVLPSLQRPPRSDSLNENEDSTASGPRQDKKSNELSAAPSHPRQASSGSQSRRRKGPPPPPDLDLATARLVCATTEAALAGFGVEELRGHIEQVEELSRRASETLEYWLKRKDEGLGDKEAFEGVIENLVKHARRVRK
ncbi:MAG: hypothetical protein M1816_006848 [Peltula sp. TS41687]|nr:MAG: hypothetical protein M1816_006848 [Peltula sp. TS41687]